MRDNIKKITPITENGAPTEKDCITMAHEKILDNFHKLLLEDMKELDPEFISIINDMVGE